MEFASLKDLLKRSPALRRLREHGRVAELQSLWAEAAGADVAGQSRLLRYRDGKLSVSVGSPSLLQELSTYRKTALMERLKAFDDFRGLIDIVFKNG
jgi:hypothetical protein